METRCAEQLQTAQREIRARQEESKQALTALQEQTCSDRTVLERQRAELEEQVEESQRLVHSFLQEELKQDVPTGEQQRRQNPP